MFKKIQERVFPFIIATSALSVSASAAFYSVSGLSKLFAGATLAVIIMATSLEVAKLVIASLLYQYRKTLPLGLKVYLTSAAAVLVLITSMGIYGFLSAAYQETANKAGNLDAQIALVEVKRDNVREQLAVYNTEKSTINGAVSDLRSGLSNNTIQYKDKETGQIITTTSSRTRKALEKQLDQAIERQTEINSKVDELNEQLFKYETEIVEIKTGNDLAGELGPLKYLSGLTGVPMDQIINYLLLTIIFVFDPLAISLVIAANYAFERLKPKTKGATIEEQAFGTDWEDESMWTEEEMEDFNNQFNADDMLPDEENQLEFDFDNPVENNIHKFDLDGDGVIEEEELKQVINQADINNDGVINKKEALASDLSIEETQQLNELNQTLDSIHKISTSFSSAEGGKKRQITSELDKLKSLVFKNLNSKSDDNQKTYF